MRSAIIGFSVLLIYASLSGCEKKADNAAPWLGTYTGTGTDSLSQVTITEVNRNTINIRLLARNDSGLYTFGDLQNAIVISPTNIIFNENDSLYPNGGDYYNITGQGMLNGNTLTLLDTAKNTVSLNPQIIFSFTGNK